MLKILIGIALGFLLFSNQGAPSDDIRYSPFDANALDLAPEVDGPTLQEQIKELLEETK